MRHQRYDLEHLDQGLQIYLVEAVSAAFAFHGRNRHSYNRIFLVLPGQRPFTGEIVNHSAGEILPLQSGHIYFMPAHCDLEFTFAESMRFISFHFHAMLFNYCELFQGTEHCAAMRDCGRWGTTAEELLRSSVSPMPTLLQLRRLLLTLIENFLPKDPAALSFLENAVRRHGRLLAYIAAHGSAVTTTSELAQISGLSRGALSRQFAADFGFTLKHYLTRELIRRAEQMLLLPTASVRQVAENLQFNNEFYFSRFFKKHTGRTPRDFHQEKLRRG